MPMSLRLISGFALFLSENYMLFCLQEFILEDSMPPFSIRLYS